MSDDDTVDFDRQKSYSETFFAPYRPPYRVSIGGVTDPGKVRTRNEDHFAVIRRTRKCDVLATNLKLDELDLASDEAYGLVVADGVGGADFGDFASELALHTMFELAGRATSWIMKFTDVDAHEIRERVDAYVEQIQRTFQSYIRHNPQMKEMGTTWTSAYLTPPHAVVVHIGDSRAYLYRKGKLTRVTQDQTVAQEMIDAGLPPEDVKRFGHVLTNSISGDQHPIHATIIHLEIQHGDRILICSDGLSDMVSESDIAGVLEQRLAPQETCQRLLAAALEAGGRDNITIVLGDLEPSPEDSAQID